MKAAELRQSILQAAVQGKLVPQNPHDEPAFKLLERIKDKKNQMVKEGRQKREKPLPSFDENEEPYDLPQSWIWCQLGELSTIKGGKRIPKGMTFSKEVTPFIYIRVTDMKNYTIVENSLKYITPAVYDNIKNYTISHDDIYITIAGTIGKCGVVPFRFHNMCLTENAAKISRIYSAGIRN